jgi:hypothetical protein
MNQLSGRLAKSAATPRGRKIGWRKPPLQSRVHSDTSTFSIGRWCIEADCSRTWLYHEWTQGQGPNRVRVGGKIMIVESPRDYALRVAQEQDHPDQMA